MITVWITHIAAHADTAFTYQGELRQNGGLADGSFNMDFDLWDAAHGGHHDVGMIAEEVGEVLPEIVAYEENGVDASSMDYSKLTPLLVEVVNALHAEKGRRA